MSSLRLLVISVLLLCGCGGPAGPLGDPVVTVSGNVTLDGQPLPNGQIWLVETGREPPRNYIGAIQGGAFQCEAPPGSVRVEIRSYKETSLEEEAQQIIPVRYNEASELTAELQPDAPANLSFHLESD